MERYQIKVMSMIRTERLTIYSASQEQMEAMIASEQNEELKKAYTEMLEGCLRHLREDGIAEIGYGILEEYQGQGYATEAAQAACRWAFLHPDVRSLEAETDAGNAASQIVLEKCGFRPNGTFGEEGPRFTLGRPIDAGETG